MVVVDQVDSRVKHEADGHKLMQLSCKVKAMFVVAWVHGQMRRGGGVIQFMHTI